MDSEAPDVVFVFSMVDYGIHAYTRRGDIFSSQKSVFVY